MQNIEINASTPYTVHLGTWLLEKVGEITREANGGARAAVITDETVSDLYAGIVVKSLSDANYRVSTFAFEPGEGRKNLETYAEALEFLAAAQLSRTDVVVAVGGGVVGDLAGFVAATYMRGIDFVQVPTTLLAMVDSSVGGKCAVDLRGGKNLAGAFWQPKAVIADLGCLATLSDEQFRDGTGEIIKHAAIADANLFSALEEMPLTLQTLNDHLAYVEAVVSRNIQIKSAVVSMDEKEGGARKLLNFGHTIGHAVEALEEYGLGHGSCVAIGMCTIARATNRAGSCDDAVPQRIEALCRAHGLPVATDRKADEIFDAALHDKKRGDETIDLVLPHIVGACSIDSVSLDLFHRLISLGLSAE